MASGSSWAYPFDIASDKPTQNGVVENFNGRVRDKLLHEMLFFTGRQARSILAPRSTT